MSREEQGEIRNYQQLNGAIDNLSTKIRELRQDMNSVLVLHHLILGYQDGKLNEEEISRLYDEFSDLSADRIDKLVDFLTNDNNKELLSMKQMIDRLEEGRWDK